MSYKPKVLETAAGGTNVNASGTSGNVLTSNGTNWISSPPATSGTVTSVSGTANRITSTGGATPVIDISAVYVGQSSITTLGTVTTGVWNGTTIGTTFGGTGLTSYTTGDILYASASNVLSKLSVGSNAQVLTLAAGVPTWATPTTGTVTNLTGNSGGALSPTAGNFNILTANSTPVFAGSGSTLTLDFSLTNLCLGTSFPSITSAVSNVVIGGLSTGNAITSGSTNVIIGASTAISMTTGGNSVIIGSAACNTATNINQSVVIGNGAFSAYTGSASSRNTCVGYTSGSGLLTGTNNLFLGVSAGNNYTTSESSNICLMSAGTVGESNVIRIGDQGSSSGQQNKCYIAGITAVTVAGSAPVAVDTNGQLSSLGFGTSGQVLKSNGAATSPTWQAASTGDVVGPASSTDNALVRFDLTTGKLIQNGVITEDDTGNLSIAASVSGGSLSATVSNTSNTASATAHFDAVTGGASSGDPYFGLSISGVTGYSMGIDNSDSDRLKITSSFVGPSAGNTFVSIATTGEINYPLQPAFLAVQQSVATNATGDATKYTLGSTVDLTEIYDNNSDFDPSTGTFTAPVTGKYYLEMSTFVTGGTAITSEAYEIVTTAETYRKRSSRAAACVQTETSFTHSVVANMTATDTATFNLLTVDSGGKVGDVYGDGTDAWTYVCGYLVC